MAKLTSTQLNYARERVVNHFANKRGSVLAVEHSLDAEAKLALIKAGVATMVDKPLVSLYGVNITDFFTYPADSAYEEAKAARNAELAKLTQEEQELLDKLYLSDAAEALALIKTLS